MTLARTAPALFVFLWSTGWVTARYATHYTGPLTFLCLRYAFAGALFYIVARVSGASFPRSGKVIRHAAMSGVLLHGCYLGMVWWAVGQGVPAAISGIIAGLQPLMTGLAATFLLGERLSTAQKAGLVLGFVGVAIAVLPRVLALDSGASAIPAFAVMVNVIAMVAVTAGTLYQKHYLQSGDLRAIGMWQYAGALAVTVPFAMLLEDGHIVWGAGLALTLLWAVVGISMGAVALLLYLIRLGQVSRAASLIYLVPPLAAVEAAILFGEELSVAMMTGTVVSVAGVYLANRKQSESSQPG